MLTVETIYDRVIDRHLYVAAYGVSDTVGPGPEWTDYRFFWILTLYSRDLGGVDIGHLDDKSGPCNEVAEDWQSAHRGSAEIGEIVEFDAAPL